MVREAFPGEDTMCRPKVWPNVSAPKRCGRRVRDTRAASASASGESCRRQIRRRGQPSAGWREACRGANSRAASRMPAEHDQHGKEDIGPLHRHDVTVANEQGRADQRIRQHERARQEGGARPCPPRAEHQAKRTCRNRWPSPWGRMMIFLGDTGRRVYVTDCVQDSPGSSLRYWLIVRRGLLQAENFRFELDRSHRTAYQTAPA